MLLSLPNELLLVVGSFLDLHDVRRLRLACRRVRTVLDRDSTNKVLYLHNEKGLDHFQWSSTPSPTQFANARALLVHTYLKRIVLPPIFLYSPIIDYSPDEISYASSFPWNRFRSLRYFSLSCTIAEPDSDQLPATFRRRSYKDAPRIRSEFWTPFVLSNLTHLEIVGYRVDINMFRCFNEPKLKEVSLCLPPSTALYSEDEAADIFKELQKHPIERLTMTVEHITILMLLPLMEFNSLTSLALVWSNEDSIIGENLTVYECGRGAYIELYACAFSRIKNLQHLYVPLCPGTLNSVRLPRGSRNLGSGVLLESERLIVPDEGEPYFGGREQVNKIKVIDTEVQKICELFNVARKGETGVCLIGWLVPVPHYDEFRPLWCKLETDEDGEMLWTCDFQEKDPWPETQLDIVFS